VFEHEKPWKVIGRTTKQRNRERKRERERESERKRARRCSHAFKGVVQDEGAVRRVGCDAALQEQPKLLLAQLKDNRTRKA
jgi:hypothetical protein